MSDFNEEALEKHRRLRGKIAVQLKDSLDSREQLSIYYTPGVAAVSKYVAEHPEKARDYTWLNNSVAVISDGSAVLGLGRIGPLGALPVMEGKCMLFKHFAGIDAVPIVLNVHRADKVIAAVRAIAPSFGGINLEDVAAPACFEIEDRLKKELSIPVVHDDQHGTAVVVLAGLINALKVRGLAIGECKIVISGAGAAGIAIANLLWKYGARNILVADSKGVIGPHRQDLNPFKQKLVEYNADGTKGSLRSALVGAEVFIGVSTAGLLESGDISRMAKDPIVFAMANPVPEIMPDEAKRAGALVVATGRSDFANQINNALAFPGMFRGALDNGVKHITDDHKIAAAEAIAALVDNPTPDYIIPALSNERLVPAIAKVIV